MLVKIYPVLTGSTWQINTIVNISNSTTSAHHYTYLSNKIFMPFPLQGTSPPKVSLSLHTAKYPPPQLLVYLTVCVSHSVTVTVSGTCPLCLHLVWLVNTSTHLVTSLVVKRSMVQKIYNWWTPNKVFNLWHDLDFEHSTLLFLHYTLLTVMHHQTIKRIISSENKVGHSDIGKTSFISVFSHFG